MRGAIHIGWRYLAFHRIKTLILVGCLTVVLLLPVALRILVSHTEQQLTVRADATPLLIGARGSPLELTLNSLYFDAGTPPRLDYSELETVRDSGLALAIPLYLRFQSGEHPIVGTSLDYFEYRELRIANGRQMQRIGDCVLGAAVATKLGVKPGDSVTSSPESVFDLAGVFPLKMRVTGVLEFSNSPDDHAIFADIKTTWIIEGLTHGHDDLANQDGTSSVLKRNGDRITANASVVQYNEITEDNIGSFHFHGDTSGFPMTAVIALPSSDKSEALLMGRYVDKIQPNQILTPRTVINDLLATILTVQQYINIGMALLGAATLSIVAMVFLLSIRLRQREIETLHKIGGQRLQVLAICTFEIIFVLSASLVLTGLLALVIHLAGPDLIRLFL